MLDLMQVEPRLHFWAKIKLPPYLGPVIPRCECNRVNEMAKIESAQNVSEFKEALIDLDYAYGQMKLSEETSRQCVFALTGGNFSGYYKFKKGFYRLADVPAIFQEKFD